MIPLTPYQELMENLRKQAYVEWERSGQRWVDNWFSNMRPFERPLPYASFLYYAPENFYQAMKSGDPDHRGQCAIATPSKSKRLGRGCSLRPDWDLIKVDVMLYAVRWKFTLKTHVGQQLLDTGDYPIVEWNNWGDRFWGKSILTGHGYNMLGRLLELRRAELASLKWPPQTLPDR